MFKRLYIFAILLIILTACKSEKEINPEIAKIQIDLQFESLEDKLFEISNKEEMRVFLKERPRFCLEYLEVPGAAEDDQMLEFLLGLYSNETLNEFNREVQEKFRRPPLLQDEFISLFQHIRYYYPDFTPPKINTIVTGFKLDKDISVSDSLIVVSIDYFAGKEASYRPLAYNYFLSRYEKEFIVPMAAMALSNKYNEVDHADESMLAHMIYHGKTLYFMETMMPLAHDSLLIMYSGQQIEEVKDNLDVIWAHFIEKQLFFETKPKTIDRYIGETPKVIDIGDKCPGRIGRWLGWQIVRKYMDRNPEISLQQLMKEKDAQKIFKEARYKP